MKQINTEPDLLRYTQRVANDFEKGKVQLFMVKEYSGTTVEVVHFMLLLTEDVFTSMRFEGVDPKVQEEFPVGSAVWINKELFIGGQVRITEATCLDEIAKAENELVKQKLFKDDLQTIRLFEGESRLRCSTPDRKVN